MMSTLFNLLGGGNNIFQNTPFGNMMNFMQSFNQFRQSFQGNPQEQVQQLLDSGKMSQDQFNQFQQMAMTIRSFFR